MFNKPVTLFKIPKTGCTSFKKSAREIGFFGNRFKLDKINLFCLVNHENLAEYKERKLYEHRFDIAIIRNPAERFISGFNMSMDRNWVPRNWTPYTMLENLYDDDLNNNVKVHLRYPQTMFTHHDGECIVDRFVRLEDYDAQLSETMLELGLTNFPIYHLNKTEQNAAMWIVENPDFVKLHKKVFEEDWKLLGYE